MKFKIINQTNLLVLIIFSIISSINNLKVSNNLQNKDPFAFLGIEDLNPKKLLQELEQETPTVSSNLAPYSRISRNKSKNTLPQLKTLQDLPNFLKQSKLKEDEALTTLTKFLIQDDVILKKYGVIYDQTGFDGINSIELISSPGTEERLKQRARSAGNIFFREKYPGSNYDAYGAEEQSDEIILNWKVYKVLLIGKNGESTFVKVCLPIDESEPALCGITDDLCGYRAKFVDKQKIVHQDYINTLKGGGFFSSTTKKEQKSQNNVNLPPRLNEKDVPDSKIHNVKDNALFNLIQKASETNPEQRNDFQFKEKEGMKNENNLRNQMVSQIGSQMENQIGNQMGNQMLNPMGNQMINPMGNSMINPMMNQMGNQMGNAGYPMGNMGNTGYQMGNVGNQFPHNNLENEIAEMKKQLSFLMNSVKEKDSLINQQKQKIEELSKSQPSNNNNSNSFLSLNHLGIGNNYGTV